MLPGRITRVAARAIDESDRSDLHIPRTLRPRVLAILMIVTGVVGWYSSFALVMDKITLLENPKAALGCDLNPFISCGDVLGQWQASLFGFPNPIIGLGAYIVPIIIGTAVLAGVEFPRWIWLGLNIGVLLGAAFITWLFTQSVFAIAVLCPWCMLVWSMQIPLFVTVTLHNSAYGRFGRASTNAAVRAVTSAPWTIVALWYAVIVLSILFKFWGYWSRYL
ncbi:vitamin K epoxide reductase family protein [Spelaeicoccus albus]